MVIFRRSTKHAIKTTMLTATDYLTVRNSMNQQTLETSRLVLRPLALEDAPAISRLAGRREIADTTLAIPHPYSEVQAQEWLKAHVGPSEPNRREMIFAVTLKPDDQLIGTMGLREIDKDHCLAEIGFWVGVDFWGKGYATEAAAELLRFAFEDLALN